MRSVVATALVVAAAVPVAAQRLEPFIPIGVVVHGAGGVTGDRRDFLTLAKRRFNVIGVRDRATGELRLSRLVTWLEPGADDKPAAIPANGVVAVSASTSGKELRLHAWQAIAKGARGIVFEPLVALMHNEDALDAASEFADNVTRNAALFAPLRPRESTADVRVDAPAATIDARFLESNAAFVLIVANQTSDVHRVTLKFSSEFPEAIWQNMETGAAVNFVASAEGPTYTRTFTPFDVVVLMIRKQYK
ncbi:MAG: hypothetical protein WBC51_27060 [Vicinamibacterales bacterium]